MSDGLCSAPEVITDAIDYKKEYLFCDGWGRGRYSIRLIFSKITVSADFCYFSSGKVK
ncbi:MAG: hypothetical protein WCO13_08090 [Bacteroidota bacterium]